MIYSRVSKDSRAGRSVAEQETEARAACEREGWTIERVHRDNDVSASRFTTRKRPAWQQLVDELDEGSYDLLVLWEPSRGSRDLVAWAALLDACRRRGVLIHVVSHNHTYDLPVPRDWRSLAEDGVDSAYESEKTSQRIQRAMLAGAVAGRPHGRVPYGYQRTYDPHTKALVSQEPDPETAPIVREIITRLAGSEPVISVMRDLNARGVPSPTGGQWRRQMVRRVGLRRAYLGEREHQGEIYAADWPALIDAATAAAARRVLEDPARTVTRPGRSKYLLSYVAHCDVCGRGLSAAARNRGVLTYFCPGAHTSVRVAWLDEFIEGVILTRLSEDTELLALLAQTDDSDVLEARDEVARLRERLAEFRDAAAAGDLTPASLAHVEARLTADIATAEKRATGAGSSRALASLVSADDLQRHWAAMPLAARREVVRLLLSVRLARATKRGHAAATEYERVKIEWKTDSQTL